MNFGTNSNINPELLSLLKKENIHTKIFNSKNKCFWLGYKYIPKQDISTSELTKRYSICTTEKKCISFFKGKLHMCPISSHGMDLGIIPNDFDEYIDFSDKKISNNVKRKKILNLMYNKKYISACNYCKIKTDIKNINKN